MTNCFCVPHKEHDDQVEAELGYAHEVFELNRRVNPNENIVGEFPHLMFPTQPIVTFPSPNPSRLVGHRQ